MGVFESMSRGIKKVLDTTVAEQRLETHEESPLEEPSVTEGQVRKALVQRELAHKLSHRVGSAERVPLHKDKTERAVFESNVQFYGVFLYDDLEKGLLSRIRVFEDAHKPKLKDRLRKATDIFQKEGSYPQRDVVEARDLEFDLLVVILRLKAKGWPTERLQGVYEQLWNDQRDFILSGHPSIDMGFLARRESGATWRPLQQIEESAKRKLVKGEAISDEVDELLEMHRQIQQRSSLSSEEGRTKLRDMEFQVEMSLIELLRYSTITGLDEFERVERSLSLNKDLSFFYARLIRTSLLPLRTQQQESLGYREMAVEVQDPRLRLLNRLKQREQGRYSVHISGELAGAYAALGFADEALVVLSGLAQDGEVDSQRDLIEDCLMQAVFHDQPLDPYLDALQQIPETEDWNHKAVLSKLSHLFFKESMQVLEHFSAPEQLVLTYREVASGYYDEKLKREVALALAMNLDRVKKLLSVPELVDVLKARRASPKEIQSMVAEHEPDLDEFSASEKRRVVFAPERDTVRRRVDVDLSQSHETQEEGDWAVVEAQRKKIYGRSSS